MRFIERGLHGRAHAGNHHGQHTRCSKRALASKGGWDQSRGGEECRIVKRGRELRQQ